MSVLTNIDNIDLWFEYSDLLLDIADEVDSFRRRHRNVLTTQQKEKLKFYSSKIRSDARTWATVAGESLLSRLEPQLTELKTEVKKIEDLQFEITNAASIILEIAKVIDIVTKVFQLIPNLLG
ncbi:hypothetical protein IQ274_28605 [Nostoc sp. LEGE 12447]|uniref:hypothetical protein n=1 Tax=Nostoc sp. LEGE 12447 TaxID=1828640 RepID=UPI00188470F8|nr:hypothetical protein [Nostoc sp. LEGE 12447]MBE9002058.1 hypothetical protein [Nostoc sp. LEGE 12447]